MTWDYVILVLLGTSNMYQQFSHIPAAKIHWFLHSCTSHTCKCTRTSAHLQFLLFIYLFKERQKLQKDRVMRNPSSPDGSQVVFGLGSGKPLQYIYMQLAMYQANFIRLVILVTNNANSTSIMNNSEHTLSASIPAQFSSLTQMQIL